MTAVRPGRKVPSRSEAGAIDPRISARIESVTRDRRRRWLGIAAVVATLLALAAAAYGVVQSQFLDVDHFDVEGAGHTSTSDIVAATGVVRGDQLAFIDTAAASRRVEALPWVAEAKVDRSYPATLTIDVAEYTAAAAIETAEGWAVIDQAGHVLEFSEAQPQLIVLGGMDAPQPGSVATGASGALSVVDALPAAVGPRIGRIDVVDSKVTLGLVAGGVVSLGRAVDLDAKMEGLETVLEQVDLRCLIELDLRVATYPVLTRDQTCN